MRKNHILQSWRANEPTLGGWISMDSTFAVEIMANAGFDWLCLDMQHGMLDYNDVRQLLPAISTTQTIPLVRVPWNEPYEIMKVLDAGAYGVVVPMVNNRTEAEQAVSACRYPPAGGRSYGPARALIYAGEGYAEEANNEIACVVMIETRESLDTPDEIMTTPGLDGIYIGPSDLAFALGLNRGQIALNTNRPSPQFFPQQKDMASLLGYTSGAAQLGIIGYGISNGDSGNRSPFHGSNGQE